MEITKKLFSFITEKKENSQATFEYENEDGWVEKNPQFGFTNTQYIREPFRDEEIIQSIEKHIFNDDKFDITKDLLEKLDGMPSLADIDTRRASIKRELQAVSRKIYNLVLENRPAYESGHLDIIQLQESLHLAVLICSESRSLLNDSKRNFTETSLSLLANCSKRKQLLELFASLRTIKTLQQTDKLLKELLQDQDYYGAIQLFQDYKTTADAYAQFTCIRDLSNKMEDKLNMIEEALDVALSLICRQFDKNIYTRIQKALFIHGKSQGAMDQLLMHFSTCIFNTSFAKVLGYVQLGSAPNESVNQKNDFTQLCKLVKNEFYLSCLVDLCKALWDVLLNYRHVVQWHSHYTAGGEEINLQKDEPCSDNVVAKLHIGRSRIWNEVQQKIKTYLVTIDLTSLKFEEFIKILDVVSILINVGACFCESQCEILQGCVREQSAAFFVGFHQAHLDELYMFFENEAWVVCPVKTDFSVKTMQEFKSLLVDKTEKTSNVKESNDLFETFATNGTPFNNFLDQSSDNTANLESTLHLNNGLSNKDKYDKYEDEDDDDDVCDELKMDYVEENTGDSHKPKNASVRKPISDSTKQLIVTNTTLYVCRLFGKYMLMMQSIDSISYDVINAMTQLLDYYLYTVYSFFTTEIDHYPGDVLQSKLRITLKRICESLVQIETRPQQHPPKTALISHPTLSPLVALDNRKDMYGLSSRIVATESLIFLANQLKLLLPYLEEAIPTNKKAFLQQYTSQTLNIISEVRRPVYFSIVYNFIQFNKYLLTIGESNWDLQDIKSQHSAYVDHMIDDITMFSDLLSSSSLKQLQVSAVRDVIWEHVATMACEFFVEGFSSAKKCTNEGRALMLLDFNHFAIKLEKISNLRPISRKDYVEVYIRAFYYTEKELERFITEQKYAVSHLSSLINCMPQINKKSKTRLLAILEETADKSKSTR